MLAVRGHWSRLPWGALFALALLLLGELGTRLFFTPRFVSIPTYTAYYPDAYLYGEEGSRACFPVAENMVCAATQDMNIIPTTFPLKKPPGELRIIVIGASISWEGPRPSQSVDNYPSRTLALLQEAHPGRAIRLINLSVPGTGSTRQMVRYREALTYDPDLFIIHMHDTNEQREDQRRGYVRGLHSGLAGKLLYLNSVVVLKKWWGEQLGMRTASVADGSEEVPDANADARVTRWMSGMQERAQTMLDLARARSIPVIFVAASRGDNQRLSSWGGKTFNAFLQERAASSTGQRVQFVDVPSLFRTFIDTKHRRPFKDKIHYNADGTRLVAGELVPRVEAALPALQR